jgi:isopenicillin N synthase-like dioxygenase
MDAVPKLDVRRFRGQERDAFVHALGEALMRYGFVAISGHDITEALTAPSYEALRRFFAMPEAVKRKYVLPGTGGARGYTPFGIETAKDQSAPDLKEFFHVGRELARDNPYGMRENVWPSEVPELRASTLALWHALEQLGSELLRAIALFLALDEHWFADKIDHGNSILRPLHYPPLSAEFCSRAEPRASTVHGVRSAAHEDINLITLLVSSGEPGLEILPRGQGTEAEPERWLAIAPAADQVVVNVGDMLQRLTNHVLVSTTHRVVNPESPWHARSRYSIPFFLHPNPEFLLSTLPSCVSDREPDRYPVAITANAYLEQRLREIGLL